MKELPVMKPYIGGAWIESESQKFTTIYDPSTGNPIAQVPQCTAAEVEKAIAAAKAAYPAWKNTPVRTRANIMMKLRNLIERDKEELTLMVATENGKCWSEELCEMFGINMDRIQDLILLRIIGGDLICNVFRLLYTYRFFF